MLARRSSSRRFAMALSTLALGIALLAWSPLDRVSGQQGRADRAGPREPLDPAAVDRAIESGVRFLRQTQNPQGHWGAGTGPGSDKGWAVGYTCLAGLALVECGVPTTDPGLRNALSGIRRYASDLDSTYEVALAILFLDRMGEKSDQRTIQMLASRLIAGQTPTGGWGYKVPKHGQSETTALLGAIRKLSPPQPVPPPSFRARPGSLGLCIKASDDSFRPPPPPDFDPVKARKRAIDTVPSSMKKLPVLQDPAVLILEDPKEKRHIPTIGTTDNSNTHFAIIGLWAARKHDVPADRSFTLLVQRFRTSQGANGTWSYDYIRGGANGPLQMTCVALLGLAIGHVLDADPAVKPEKDPRVVNAFAALSPRIGEPAGSFENRPAIKDAGGLYFFWAMERIAVLYDVRQLDKKDWYRWGAEILIGHQSQDGSWTEDGGYHGQHPVLNTAFALMFLKRANLTPDLSRRLTVDVAALTSKVDDKASPKPATPSPTQPDPPPVVAPEPQPPLPDVEAPQQSQPVQSQPAAATPPDTHARPASKSNIWLLIVVLVLLVLVGGGIAFFVARRSRTDDDDDEQPRKRKKKGDRKRLRAEEDDD